MDYAVGGGCVAEFLELIYLISYLTRNNLYYDLADRQKLEDQRENPGTSDTINTGYLVP